MVRAEERGVASWPPPKPNRSLWPEERKAALGAGTRLPPGAGVETDQKLDLLERDTELGALEDLFGSGDAGGLLLAIEGPPGIGKTALMAEAKSRGGEAGMRVLGARGSELERSFSFGVVRQLFEPLLVSLLEDERADALAGAAALAEPLFNPELFNARPGPTRRLRRCTASTGCRRTSLRADRFCSRSTTFTGAIFRRCAGSPTCCRAWRALPSLSLVGLRPAEAGEDPGSAGPDRGRPAGDRDPPCALEPRGDGAVPARGTLALGRRCVLRLLPRGDGRQPAAPARARACDLRRRGRADGGATCLACASSRRVPGRAQSRCGSRGFRRRRRRWQRPSRCSAMTPIYAGPLS